MTVETTTAADLALKELQRLLQPIDPLAGLDSIPAVPTAQPANRFLIKRPLSSIVPFPPPEPKENVRQNMVLALHDYANRKTRNILLVSAPAGIGKSYAGIQFVQERAALGEKWLWAAQNHAMYDDISRQPNFDASLWYHWQPMDGEIDGAPACRYPGAQRVWTEKGYKARKLCWQLCGRKGKGADDLAETYMERCPFRTQKERQGAVTFVMHQHLFTGLDIGHVDGVVIDETFISLLARERWIPGDQLRQGNINLRVIELANTLVEIWTAIKAGISKPFVSGKDLLDRIGSIYPDVVTQLQELAEAEELKKAAKFYRNPPVFDPGQVDALQNIYMDDLTKALAPEYQAWQAGLTTWAERVWIDREGLHFVSPAPLWDGLPRRIVVLDATGKEEFYRAVFLRQVEEYRPNVARLGHVYQVAGRMYNKGIATTRKPVEGDHPKTQKYETSASKTTTEFIQVARELIEQRGYKNVAVITQQNVEKIIRAGLNLTEADTLHFYKLRGRNDLQNRDCILIFGTPTPAERTITNIALAMNPRMIEPIYKLDEDGKRIPIYVPVEREFRLNRNGLESIQEAGEMAYYSASRVIGYYPDPLMATIQTQMREAEILQAVYRARLIDNPADVWIFSSVPIDGLELDGVYDDPPIAPGKIGWKLWLKIKAWHDALPAGAVYGYEELSAALDVRVDYLKRIDALTAIQEFFGDRPHTLEKAKSPNVKKGRKRREFQKK